MKLKTKRMLWLLPALLGGVAIAVPIAAINTSCSSHTYSIENREDAVHYLLAHAQFATRTYTFSSNATANDQDRVNDYNFVKENVNIDVITNAFIYQETYYNLAQGFQFPRDLKLHTKKTPQWQKSTIIGKAEVAPGSTEWMDFNIEITYEDFLVTINQTFTYQGQSQEQDGSFDFNENVSNTQGARHKIGGYDAYVVSGKEDPFERMVSITDDKTIPDPTSGDVPDLYHTFFLFVSPYDWEDEAIYWGVYTPPTAAA